MGLVNPATAEHYRSHDTELLLERNGLGYAIFVQTIPNERNLSAAERLKSSIITFISQKPALSLQLGST